MGNVIEALPLKRRLLCGKSTALPFIAFQKEAKPATRGKEAKSATIHRIEEGRATT